MGGASIPERGGPDQFPVGMSAPEVLEGSAPSTTLVRRGADWAAARASRAWGRHRAVIVSVLGAALVAGAVTAAVTRPWQVRPGPFDPVVRVDLGIVDRYQADPYSLGESGIVWAASYTIGRLDPTARYGLVGVSGPGLVDPMTVRLDAASTWSPQQPVIRLGASLACADARLGTATAADYRVTLSRTDAFGRTATASVPVNDSGAWRHMVLGQCLARDLMFALRLTGGSARIESHPRRVSVAIRISNPLPYGMVLRAAPPSIVAPGDALPSGRTEIPAGSTSGWTVNVAVGSCAAPGALERINVQDDGTRITRRALTVFAALAGDHAPTDDYFNYLALPDLIADPVDGLLRSACSRARH